jgi:hypothetical protein
MAASLRQNRHKNPPRAHSVAAICNICYARQRVVFFVMAQFGPLKRI